MSNKITHQDKDSIQEYIKKANPISRIGFNFVEVRGVEPRSETVNLQTSTFLVTV